MLIIIIGENKENSYDVSVMFVGTSVVSYPAPAVYPTPGGPAHSFAPGGLQAAGTHNYAAATRPGSHWDNLHVDRDRKSRELLTQKEGKKAKNITILCPRDLKISNLVCDSDCQLRV